MDLTEPVPWDPVSERVVPMMMDGMDELVWGMGLVSVLAVRAITPNANARQQAAIAAAFLGMRDAQGDEHKSEQERH